MSQKGGRPCTVCASPRLGEVEKLLLAGLDRMLQNEVRRIGLSSIEYRNGTPVVEIVRRRRAERNSTRRQRQLMRGATVYRPKNTLRAISAEYNLSVAALFRHRAHLLRQLASQQPLGMDLAPIDDSQPTPVMADEKSVGKTTGIVFLYRTTRACVGPNMVYYERDELEYWPQETKLGPYWIRVSTIPARVAHDQIGKGKVRHGVSL